MVSLSASAQVTINREPTDVWAYVSDVTNQDHWVDGMSDSEVVGNGPVSRGTQIRGVYTYGGNDGPVEMTVTEFREGRELAIETSEGPFPFTGRLTLERSGTSTIVSNSMTAGSDHNCHLDHVPRAAPPDKVDDDPPTTQGIGSA